MKTSDELLDKVKYKRFIELVDDSTTKLIKWHDLCLDQGGKSGGGTPSDKFIGGHEGLSFHLDIAKIDQDANGSLTVKEYEEFVVQSEKTIDKSMQLLLNSGVVGALLLSFLFPLCLQDLEPSEESMELLGEIGVTVCKYVYFLLLFFTNARAFLIISLSMRFYVYLGYWLSDIESKLEFLAQNPMLLLALLDLDLLGGAPLIIVPAISEASSPYIGLIALLSLLYIGVYNIRYGEGKFGPVSEELLENDAHRFVEMIQRTRSNVRLTINSNPMILSASHSSQRRVQMQSR